MAGTKGIRWPTDLEGVVEKAAAEDDRTFSSEVVYLIRLGLVEREIKAKLDKARVTERLMAAEPTPPVYLKESAIS